MSNAVPKHCADNHVIELICFASKVRSTTVTNATNAVAFNNSTVKLAAGGYIIGKICGIIILLILFAGVKFNECAASHCPFGTASIPALTISAPYAPKFKPKATTPAVKASNDIPKKGKT